MTIIASKAIISFYKFHCWIQKLTLSLGILGTLMAVLSLLFILTYLKHKLVRATSSFTSFLIILSLLVGNITLFELALVDPSPIACTIFSFSQGLCFGIIFASLMVKILRLLRVWRCTKHGIRTIRYANNNAVFVQTIIVSIFQVSYNINLWRIWKSSFKHLNSLVNVNFVECINHSAAF